jgi:hypothetical protein
MLAGRSLTLNLPGSAAPAAADNLQRASAYLATCDPAVETQGGHNKLFWAASAMVHKFKLSDSQAYDILAREFNPRCVPPWNLDDPKDFKDFSRKISEARKNPPAIVHQWEQEEALERGEVSQAMRDGVAEMLRNAPNTGTVVTAIQAIQDGRTKPIESVINESELKFLTSPPGLVGEICDWINRTAMCPQPLLSLGCTLAFCGGLFGRKVKDHLDTRTNIYCMGVARSSAGKNHAPKQIRRLCAAAGCLDLIGGDSTASDSAIEERMCRHPATVFLWDEIGHLLSVIKTIQNPHLKQIISLFMRLYSASGSVFAGREYADTERQRIITEPCCCLYGTSTPERFTEGISPEELKDGWLSRCLVFRVYNIPEKTWDIGAIEVPESLYSQIGKWFMRQIEVTDGHNINAFVNQLPTGAIAPQPPAQIVVPVDGPAEQMLRDFHHESKGFGKEHPQLDCLWTKAEENARRVALIIAAGTDYDRPRITPAIADYACRLVRYLLLDFGRETVPAVVSGRIDAQKKKLLRVIEKQGVDGCPKGFLTNRSPWTNQRERNALLMDMQEAEQIVQADKKDKPNRVYYWTLENYRRYLGKQASES